uniref:Uncharacterized protein n=1 Tax=Junco hyemalis TaxID=40217 RepID=A0A8C5J305_JUNHY
MFCPLPLNLPLTGSRRSQQVAEAPANSPRSRPSVCRGQREKSLLTEHPACPPAGPARGAGWDPLPAEMSSHSVNPAEKCKEIHDLQEAERDAFRHSIFCSLVFCFKIEVVGISTWHFLRSLMKKKSHCIAYIFCFHPQSPPVLQNDIHTLLVLLGAGPSALHSALNT